jgi:hypothetical protein
MTWFQQRAKSAGLVAAAALTLGILAPSFFPAFAYEGDDDDNEGVVLSFSTVGDSRQDPVTFDPTTAPLSGEERIWLQNTKAWSRILNTIQGQKSNFLFFDGDMIMGYGWAKAPADATVNGIVGSDLMKFYRQYGFWRGMVAGLMQNGTYVVPVPGNHETQCKACGKKAKVENEDAWRANMGDLILDTNRFQSLFGEQPANVNVSDNSAVDGLTTNQTQLSYSFDFRGSHFAVINTDPAGKDAHAPTTWLDMDLAAALARGAQHFFVFGHKPAYTYYYGAVTPLPAVPAGLDNDVASRDAFWDVIEKYGAVYFCGHEHIFHPSQPRAGDANKPGKAWQVLVGSGGSPFEAGPSDVTVNPATDRDYAWATVKVYESGKVKITGYGFDDHFGPTHVIDKITLKP